ncbi:MAG: phage holin family protein [Deltaproteobacteria bacterium]|nr:phage holin family protein [Deltaproteobacteria bacterium]
MGFLIRMTITALGLWLASRFVPGASIEGPLTFVLAALWLGVVNAVVRPIAFILTLPITLLSLGLFLLVINAGMVALVAWLLEGFRLSGFGAALLTSIVVGLTSWVGNAFIGERGRYELAVVKRRVQ